MLTRVAVVQAEDVVGVLVLLAYLGAYLWQGRGEWYRNFTGRALVTLGTLALYRFINGLFMQFGASSLLTRNILFYGAVDAVFAYFAVGIWRSGARERARKVRVASQVERAEELARDE